MLYFIKMEVNSYLNARISAKDARFPMKLLLTESRAEVEIYIGFNNIPNILSYDYRNDNCEFYIMKKPKGIELNFIGILIISRNSFEGRIGCVFKGIDRLLLTPLQMLESFPAYGIKSKICAGGIEYKKFKNLKLSFESKAKTPMHESENEFIQLNKDLVTEKEYNEFLQAQKEKYYYECEVKGERAREKKRSILRNLEELSKNYVPRCDRIKAQKFHRICDRIEALKNMAAFIFWSRLIRMTSILMDFKHLLDKAVLQKKIKEKKIILSNAIIKFSKKLRKKGVYKGNIELIQSKMFHFL